MLVTYLNELWHILLELAPWLLLGMLIAGVVHVLLPVGFVKRYLGARGFGSVFKAVAIGVPMPLCSCGVIPATLGLRKDGASKGAAIGFLISTPQTGVDSILVSATFLGLPFAIFKVVSAFISGLVGGLVVNAFDRKSLLKEPPPSTVASIEEPSERSFKDVFRFGMIQLLGDIYRWLIVGVLLAALIGTLIPEGKLAQYTWTQGLTGMLGMLLISMPMYICATASVPLAASLVVAGMSPGAALVLLMAGPTTNVATMGAIYRIFGKGVLMIYLATVAIMSLVLGSLFNGILADMPRQHPPGHLHSLPNGIDIAAVVVLLALLTWFIGRDVFRTWHRSPTPPATSAECCHCGKNMPP